MMILALLINISQAAVSAPAINIKELMALPQKNRTAIAKSQPAYYVELLNIANSETAKLEDRWNALLLTTEIDPQRSTNDLKKFTSAKAWYLKNAALLGLQKINLAQAIVEARKLIKDKALVVRSAAADILAQSETAMDKELLWNEMNSNYNFRKNQSLWIRPQIAKILFSKAKVSDTKNYIQQLKTESDTEMKALLVSSLEHLNNIQLGSSKASLNEKVALWQDWSITNARGVK